MIVKVLLLIFLGPAKSVSEAFEVLVTAAFSRHPFHRLVSGYRDKIGRRNTRFFTPIRKHIVETYRTSSLLLNSHIGKITKKYYGFNDDLIINYTECFSRFRKFLKCFPVFDQKVKLSTKVQKLAQCFVL